MCFKWLIGSGFSMHMFLVQLHHSEGISNQLVSETSFMRLALALQKFNFGPCWSTLGQLSFLEKQFEEVNLWDGIASSWTQRIWPLVVISFSNAWLIILATVRCGSWEPELWFISCPKKNCTQFSGEQACSITAGDRITETSLNILVNFKCLKWEFVYLFYFVLFVVCFVKSSWHTWLMANKCGLGVGRCYS